MAPPDPFRLPPGVTPRRYDLTLAPDLVSGTFAGSVSIAVDIAAPTASVLLNAVELEIDDAWIDHHGERRPATIALDPEHERVELTVSRPLAPGAAVVDVRFRGVLNDKLRGFYRSTYVDASGTTRAIACTQFEATDARRAFPCFDEPEMKAVFSVDLVVADDLFAVSNGAEIESSDLGDGTRRVRFADTMVMSTYLVAFVVGSLEATEPVDVDGTALRIVHPRGKGHLAAFALESGAFALRWFIDYYGIPYPGGKLDLVAVPDFAFGAMENVGCVVFREALLLVDPEHATRGELMGVADVIHHEIAHMWFGNLVTMRWWNGIWLNEAFATFMEMACTDAFRPAWRRWDEFALERSPAYDTDALASTRPIEYPVVSPADAEGMFDVLTYQKGAAVVRMLEQYLGVDAFRDGVRLYLQRHSYANTETSDLWDALEEATGQPVRRMMDGWIFQAGHPVVIVEADSRAGGVRLHQQRMAYAESTDDTRWVVPLLLRDSGTGPGGPVTRLLLDGPVAAAPSSAPVVNAGGHGFYRVRYADDVLRSLNLRALTAVERYALLDDTWSAVLAGVTSATAFFDLCARFGGEDDVTVWRRVIAGLDGLDRVVDGPARAALQAHVRAQVSPALGRVDALADPDDRARQLQGALFGAIGTLGADPATAAAARDLPPDAPADLGAAALRVVAATADRAELDQLARRMLETSDAQEQRRLIDALSGAADAAFLDHLVELVCTGDVRSQDGFLLVRGVLGSREHPTEAWRAVASRWGRLTDRLPSNTVVRMLSGLRTVTDPALAAAIESFFREHPIPQGEKILAQYLERMRVFVAFAERESDRLSAHLLSTS